MNYIPGLMAVILMLLPTSVYGAQTNSGPPPIRSDSDSHSWQLLERRWPVAEELEMIRKAAEGSDADAQFRLALMYDVGHGVQQDYVAAAEWCRKAAEQNVVDAQYNLATMYDDGRGVAQDHAEAVTWYRAAAEQGYSSAQKNLGVKFGLGQGVPQSDIEAYIWSAIAALSGDEGAVDNRNLAASKLSAKELEAAQKWAAKRHHEIQLKQSSQ